ncbi:MAG: hypothetical protein V4684_04585 [Pseudomonadota bacterium]
MAPSALLRSSPILVRAGLPLVGGQMVAHARRRRLPLLLSANAFATRYHRGHTKSGAFKAFKKDISNLDGLDCALDSAGFVAMARYRGFPWGVRDYCELVGARAWSWAAQPDLCCEPEIASDAAARLLRVAGTVKLYLRAQAAATEMGVMPLMPVLQGFLPAEYRLCFDLMPIAE